MKMRFLSALIVFLLAGCATEVGNSPYGPRYFEIRQHFSSGSAVDANSLAQSRCLSVNSSARLVNFERGGLFNFSGRGGEYSLYTYECVANLPGSEDNRRRVAGGTVDRRGDTNESAFALEEARRAREEARQAREEIQRERERLARERRQAELESFTDQQRRQNQQMMNESWRRP